ncbi:hypothetical protein PspTeo4_06792 [Pseudomonas sp. Teo4]|nr:hypothetical protein [Pseudomonas sp. Teo4]MDZ3991115.1 hypothetical protein [Pseudomonas sp. Teo4]
MNNINSVVQNEDPTEVILFLTRGGSISHPQIDRLYERNNWIFLNNCLELIELIKKMSNEGLIEQKGGGYVKAPKWRAPKFLLENKYTFNKS